MDDAVVDVYNKLQQRKLKLKYLTMKIDMEKGLVVEDVRAEMTAENENGGEPVYSQFVDECLPADEGRYCVYDFDIEGKASNLVLLTWCPDSAKIKEKMMYASTKDAVVKKLSGIKKLVQATDADEAGWDAINKLCA